MGLGKPVTTIWAYGSLFLHGLREAHDMGHKAHKGA